jgi:Copper amine oxidase N-terminal domain
MKKRIIIGLLALSLILVLAAAAWATSGTVPINVTYRDIKIVSNGSVVTADASLGEPFIYNGRTYVPIRMAAEALGLTVDWVDWANMVTITGSSSAQEVAALKAEIADLKEQLAECEDSGGDGDLGDLEEQLIDDYDAIGDVDVDDITLDGDEDDVEVTIEVDLADFEDEWADLDDSDIEDFLDDLVSDIQDEFSEDTVVDGVIIDIDSDDDLVEFFKDGDDDLEFDYFDEDYRDGGGSSGDLDDLEDQLNDDYASLDDVDISNISLDGDEDDVDVTIEVDEDEWDGLSDSDIEDWLEDMVNDIQDEFSEDTVVDGEVIDFASENTLVEFYKDGTEDLDVNF